MDNLLKIYNASTYLQNLLEDEKSDNFVSTINGLLQQSYKLLNLNLNSYSYLSYIDYIEYLLNLVNNYKNIKFTENNVKQYIVLSDYFQLTIQDEFFNTVLNNYILQQNIFYDKLYVYQPFNYYILDKFSKKNNINNKTFMYIFEINENICYEIKKLYSVYIEQKTLDKCVNIVDLDICNNSHIKDINCLQFLETVNISGYFSNLPQRGISQLLFVKNLNVSNNKNITDVNHLQLLTNLNASGRRCNVTQLGISKLLFVKNLNLFDNSKITCVNHLQLLEDLDISGLSCGIKQYGIAHLMFIKNLNVSVNSGVTNVNHLRCLENLNASGYWCGICPYSISLLTTIIKTLCTCNNPSFNNNCCHNRNFNDNYFQVILNNDYRHRSINYAD